MGDVLARAEAFAREMHADQLYGSLPYADAHLNVVADIVRRYGGDTGQIAAAWLHDVVEDCSVPIGLIYAEFGFRIGGMVGACTGFGETREQRNWQIYRKIGIRHEAALVKTADRIANVEASQPGSRHAEMYLSERDAFARQVAIHAPPLMNQRLEAAYNIKVLA